MRPPSISACSIRSRDRAATTPSPATAHADQYGNATAAVTVNLTTGTATGDSSVGIDTITGGVNSVLGSNFNDNISGGSGNDFLNGNGGNDTINGGGRQ